MTLSHASYCDAVVPEIERLTQAGAAAEPQVPVPTCPGWTMAELLRHIGSVHRWAGTMVERLSAERLNRRDLDLGLPEDDQDLPAWVAAGAEPLLVALRNADPDAPMWAWGVDQHVRFWSRRMLHETCIHRVDAERTAGLDTVVAPKVAEDGIDELLENLPPAARFSPPVKELHGQGETLHVSATDTGTSWLVTLHPGGFDWARSDGPGTASLRGPVADLYLALYNRLPEGHGEVERSGDPAVHTLWSTNAKI